MNVASKLILSLSILSLPLSLKAHQPDVSSTVLVEREDGTWLLQIRAALTAFDYIIEDHYGASAYATPEEFRELVVEYVREHTSIRYNNVTDASLVGGAVQLGHETVVTYRVDGFTDDLASLVVTSAGFAAIPHNQNVLYIRKNGFAGDRYILSDDNSHTAALRVSGTGFVLVAPSEKLSEGWLYLLLAGVVLALLLVLRAVRQRRVNSQGDSASGKHKKLVQANWLLLLVTITVTGCQPDDDEVIELPEDGNYLIAESLFNGSSLVSYEMVESTLEDGTSAECFRLTFSANPVASGPFCPETIDDVAGMGFYDGATNPGLRVFAENLLNDIEADGYNMVNDDGTVNVDDFSGSASRDVSNCLAALPDDGLQLVFLIPAEPKLAAGNQTIEEVELIGLSLDGIPVNGDPPSAINGPAMGAPGGGGTEINFPSLDPCGGHHDPAGYYHWHFVPGVINQVLDANGITEIACTNIDQTSDVQLFGFAKDGFPIYAYASEPTDLDDCGGRTAATQEYPDGVYHYVASTTDAANVPRCLKGVAAQRPFQFL